MAKARRGSTVKKGMKFFLYGKQGTWKSSFALDFMKMKSEEGKPLRVFYVDTEFGSIDNYLEDLEAEGINLDNLFIVYANTYSELEEWLDKAINDEDLDYEDDEGNEVTAVDADGNKFIADVIVVDSATPVQDTLKYAMIQTSEKRAKLRVQKKENSTASEIFVAETTAGMEFKDYDKLNSKGKNLFRSLITRTNKYVCVTSREKDLTKQVKKPDGSFGSEKIGVQPDCFKGAEYEFFTVVHMFEDEDTSEIKGQVERKDRTKVFQQGEIIDEPSPMLWQSVITKNKDRDTLGVNKKKYEDIVDAEAQDLYSKKKSSTTKKVEKTDGVEVEAIVENETTSNVDLENPQSIIDEILVIRKGLSPSKKKALSAEFTKNELPKKPEVELGVEVLGKMLVVAQGL